MARERSEEKRNSFLSVALKMFVEKGVQNTSTAEIAKGAGTAAGTLFLYFPTKQDLVNALAIKVVKELSDFINSLLDPSLSARDTFLAIWNGSIYWFLKDMGAFRFAQQIRVPGVISDDVVVESGKYFRFYYEAIQKGFKEGCLKSYPIDLIGEFFYQDIVSVMNYISRQPDTTKQGESIQQGFDLFWDGIKK